MQRSGAYDAALSVKRQEVKKGWPVSVELQYMKTAPPYFDEAHLEKLVEETEGVA